MQFFYCRLRGHTKIPMEKDFLNKATDDRQIVKEWLTNGDNIGIVCAKSGIVVVDVDNKHGGVEAWAALCLEHGEPNTRAQITPGGGKHYVFKARPGVKYKGKIQQGIDIRFNHQIVCAPSSIKGKAYSWIDKGAEITNYPDWLAVLIEAPSRRSESVQVSSEYLMSLAKEVKKYDLAYDEWCMVGMAIHSSDPSNIGLEAFLEASMGPSYQEGDEEKCVDKWNSFHSNREEKVTIRSLTHLIREKGGQVPTTCSPDDFEKINGQSSGWVEEGGKLITFSQKECVDLFNKEHRFFTKGGDACVVVVDAVDGKETVTTQNKKTFLTKTAPIVYREQKKKSVIDTNAGLIWIEDRRRLEVDAIVFAPSHSDRQVNLFHGMPKFEVSGEPRAILDLLSKSLVVRENEREWILNWLAHILQKPWQKSTLVPVHITKEGTGKGILYDMTMRNVLGEYFTAVGQASELIANFNKHLANKFLTFVDESSWRGDKTTEGVLKKLTGSEKLTVEEKFGATYEINNPSRYAIASNNDDAVCVGVSNRRFVFLHATDENAGKTDFFNPIAEAIRSHQGAEKFGAFLQNRDISSFDPYNLPCFRNGEDSKFKSLGAVGEFWQDVAREADIKLWAKQGLPQKATYDSFNQWRKDSNHWERTITPHAFWKRTQEITKKMDPKVFRVGESSLKFFPIEPREFFERIQEKMQIDINLRPQSEYYDDQEEF